MGNILHLFPGRNKTIPMAAHLIQTPEQLGLLLKSLRHTRGLTQLELARLAGVTQSRISKIEQDPTKVTMRQWLKIITALDAQLLLQLRPDDAGAQASSATDW